MNLDHILAELKSERDRIDKAITALDGLPKVKSAAATGRGGRRHISAAGRKRISEAMKKRWAERQGRVGRGKAKRTPRHMSASARARIAAAQRARWAKLKGQQKAA